MISTTGKTFISLSSLKALLGQPNLRIIDASVARPGSENPPAAFQARRIAGAQFLNTDSLVDTEHPVPGMLCNASHFSKVMKDLDIRKGDTVVCYDTNALMVGASRAYWALRVHGLDVKILSQSLNEWVAQGHPVSEGDETISGKRSPPESDSVYDYTRVNPQLIFAFDDFSTNKRPVFDARPSQAFAQGTVPGGLSVPFTEFLDQKKGGFKETSELGKTFESTTGFTDLQSQSIVCSCMRG